MSNFQMKNPLDLDNIRSVLIRLEETIIFYVIERAQFAFNPKIYQKGAFADTLNGYEGSWLEWFLKETEVFHAKARRFTSPDEYPFTPLEDLPTPVLPSLNYPELLHPNTVNVNAQILEFYVKHIVPAITRKASEGLNGSDDGQYGSAATRDVEVLQAISRRIHYGKFVSESKFRNCPKDFIPHIIKPNNAALEALITKPAVEAALLIRLGRKARLYGQDLDATGCVIGDENQLISKIDVDQVVKMYKDWIIPLTRDVEVEYLLQRLIGVDENTLHSLLNRQ